MTAPATDRSEAATVAAPTTEPDVVAALAGWQLRPGIALTPLLEGIHLRGRRSRVTLEGSRALPRLWRMLETALRSGDHAALLREAPAGSPLRKALGTVVDQLHAHDLLVEGSVAAEDGPAARWLQATADHPVPAAAAIASARPEVQATDARSALAQAAGRALERCGASPSYVAAGGADPGTSVASAALPGPGGIALVVSARDVAHGVGRGGARRLAVAAGLSGGTAFVTAPGSPEQVRADAAALTTRLGLDPAPDPAPPAPGALTALVAGAAAQRLLCAVAGLRDPAEEGDDRRILPNRPMVLIATDRPLQAAYHVWLGPDLLDPDRAASTPPDTLAEALRRMAALGDEQVGVLALPLPGALPQLPAALATSPVPSGTLVAGAARLDLARLEAICRAAELRLSPAGLSSCADRGGNPGLAVGVDTAHAWGRVLRRVAELTPRQAGVGLPEQEWLAHPQARHWWTTLNGRMGARGTLRVIRASPDEDVFRAAVRDRSGELLGQGVEATPETPPPSPRSPRRRDSSLRNGIRPPRRI